MLNQFYTGLELNELDLKINSVGSPECRPAYREKLVEYVKPHLGSMCEDCNRRFETKPVTHVRLQIENVSGLA